MTLPERLSEEEAKTVDRRKMSQGSKRHIAEHIRRGDSEAALQHLFEVVTGEQIHEWPTVREVRGHVATGDNVTLEANETIIVSVSIGGQSGRAYVDPTSGFYTVPRVRSGTHDITATVESVRVDTDDGTVETHAVDSSSVSLGASTVTVDGAKTPIGEGVYGPVVTVTDLTIGVAVEGGL